MFLILIFFKKHYGVLGFHLKKLLNKCSFKVQCLSALPSGVPVKGEVFTLLSRKKLMPEASKNIKSHLMTEL